MEGLDKLREKEDDVAHILAELLPHSLKEEKLLSTNLFAYSLHSNGWSLKQNSKKVQSFSSTACHNGEKRLSCVHKKTLKTSSSPPSLLCPETEQSFQLSLSQPYKADNEQNHVNEGNYRSNSSKTKPLSQSPEKKKKRKREEEALFMVSRQKQILERAMEKAMEFYERVKACKLQAEEREREIERELEQEENQVTCNAEPLRFFDESSSRIRIFPVLDLNLPAM